MPPEIRLFNEDCMIAMKGMKDNQYQLAIVDPPYGIGENGDRNASRSKLAIAKDYKPFAGGDREPPPKRYFDELQRVSVNQIVWGANHFISKIPYDSSCWIVWDKLNGATDFADCELAWASFRTAVRKFKFQWQGMLQGYSGNKARNEIRIHPNQKPVRLYEWLLKNYAKPGDKIIDTHFGSLSIGIACDIMGYDLDAWEIDQDYFEAGRARLERHQQQGKLDFAGAL